MEVKIAKSAGFCWGVKRAVKMAVNSLKFGDKTYCLGELIHNKREIKRLKALGMEFIDNISSLKRGSKVIIRSHGVSPEVLREIKKTGAEVIDATCPFVKDVQQRAVKLEKEGYPVLILGNPKHPEIVGIAGHVKEPMIANSVEEVLSLPKMARLGVVCQTTLNINFFKEAVSILLDKVKELKVYNTICNATSVRQREAKELAGSVDLMLVIGGKNSSNTTKLYQISKRVNPNSYHIESKDEVKPEWFEGIEKVGITAGASTPQWVIDEVVDYIRTLEKGGVISGRGVCQTAGREL